MKLKEVLRTLIDRFHRQQQIDFALSGGLALSTMGIFRFTKDIDFVVDEVSREAIHQIMEGLGYEKQDFSTEEIISYVSPLKVFGQVDFLLARRKYKEKIY
ncbi:MAG: nucleotidyl transferase AbiEii/AbiGii toxin family protein [Deltaproteobacteria bacterium]|nr:nucleotidyl transferase AbiEii/AbiGii toxin family protein [Deltaproteobacteria bacterium]